jgi:hypothetical protein
MFRELSGGLKSLPRRSWLWFGLTFAFICIIFLWRLGNLTPGLSADEMRYAQNDKSWSQIVSNPLNVPHKLIQLAIHHLAPGHPSWLRLASVGFGLIFCLAFYKLTTNWFGRAIGLFSTLTFASLPLLVIGARQVSGPVLYFAPVCFISLYGWLLKSERYRTVAWLILCFAAAVFIFTPGMFLWLTAVLVICRRPIVKAIAGLPVWQIVTGLAIIFVPIAGLAAALLSHHHLLNKLFLIPQSLPGALSVFKNVGWMILALFIKTGHTDSLIVGRLPLLNILLVAILVFGVYAMQGVARRKTAWLGLSVAYAVLAAGLNNDTKLLALGLPAISLFIAAGLRYLYIEWRSVFPRNPVPKTFALALIALVMAAQLYFGLRYALAAWPATPSTREAYVLK